MFDWNGKNVVYVGGFSGIGYGICRQLMQKKIGHLIICGRMENVEMLKKLQMESTTVKVMFVHMNIMERTNIEQAVQKFVGVIKHIDVLINGAGVFMDKSVDTMIGVNLTGLINTTMVCLPYMDKTQMGRGGMVMNIASVFGLEPAPGLEVYAAAKHGVVGFTRSMGNDHYYQKMGVMFVCACPGLTSTEEMMNLRGNTFWSKYTEELVVPMTQAKKQTPEECAMNVVKSMEFMENGCVYICASGQLHKVTPNQYWHM